MQNSGEKTILIVEDDIQIQGLLKSLLTERNYHVVIANDGWAGLHGALNVHPDLVLLDINLPIMNGVSMLLTINDMIKLDPTKRLPKIIVMSGAADRDMVLKVKALRADDFVVKPFDLKDLLSRIQRVLEK